MRIAITGGLFALGVLQACMLGEGVDGSDGQTSRSAATERGGGSSSGGPGADPCGLSDPEPNNTAADAIAFKLGVPLRGCYHQASGIDLYAVRPPDLGASAVGYFAAHLETSGKAYLDLRTADGNEKLVHPPDAPTKDLYWGSAPDTDVLVAVIQHLDGFDGPYPYVLDINYVPLDDTFEPNDTRDDPAPIALGSVEGYLVGALQPDNQNTTDDWYSVSLHAGPLSLRLQNLAVGVKAHFKVYDSGFREVRVNGGASPNAGADIDASADISEAGEYRIQVGSDARSMGPGVVPEHFTHPYRLTVLQ